MIGPFLLALTVAVTFDDLPATGGEHRVDAEILAINQAIVVTLTKRGIPAVGFVNEVGLEKNGQVVSARGGSWKWFRHPFLQTGRDLDTKHAAEAFLAEHGYRVAPVARERSSRTNTSPTWSARPPTGSAPPGRSSTATSRRSCSSTPIA